MSDVLTVARNDFRSVRRSRLLWGVVAIYVAFVAIVFYPSSADVTVTASVLGAMFLTALLLPLVAITGTYLAIAGERESNTVRFLLSQPTRRRSVVFGKLLSRGLTLLLALTTALVVAVALTLSLYAEATLGPLAAFFALTSLLVGAYTAVALAVSALVSSRSRAIAGTMAVYFLTVVLAVFPGASLETVVRRLGAATGLGVADPVYDLVGTLLSPAQAYLTAMVGALDADVGTIVPADAPAYLGPGPQAAVLVAWTIGALAVAVLAFGRAEIG